MWVYQKKLQYPVNIKQSNPAIAKLIMSQLGGPHGEKGAADRYLQNDTVCLTPPWSAC